MIKNMGRHVDRRITLPTSVHKACRQRWLKKKTRNGIEIQHGKRTVRRLIAFTFALGRLRIRANHESRTELIQERHWFLVLGAPRKRCIWQCKTVKIVCYGNGTQIMPVKSSNKFGNRLVYKLDHKIAAIWMRKNEQIIYVLLFFYPAFDWIYKHTVHRKLYTQYIWNLLLVARQKALADLRRWVALMKCGVGDNPRILYENANCNLFLFLFLFNIFPASVFSCP